MKEIALGAEARISEKDGILVKERIEKSYRLKEIDEKLRKRRTKLESTLLRDARRIGINVPRVIETSGYSIQLEKIDGVLVKDCIDQNNISSIGEIIGKQIAILHEYGIVHGDLTTSNMIFQDGRIFFIDFGLGFYSDRTEDKATDLYLLYNAIEATHWMFFKDLWKTILESYKTHFKGSDKVIKTLHQIERRGRYK